MEGSASAAASQPPPEAASKESFFRYFQQQVARLQEQMEHIKATTVSASERNEAIDNCLAGIDRLSHEAKDASSYIPAYDQRTYGEAIKALGEKLQETRSSFAPPKKFKFSSARKNNPANSLSEPAALSAKQSAQPPASTQDSSNAPSSLAPTPLNKISPASERREEEASNTSNVQISGHTNTHFVLPPSTSQATSGTITSIQHSAIDLSPRTSPPTGQPFAGLILTNISESLVVCGRVDGPAHITGVQDSVLVVTCRQFRMHSSTNVTIYLHCSSRPIIEDCTGLRFAPLPASYAAAIEDSSKNQWDQIDDFKWLKAEPSPNFQLLAEEDRVEQSVWNDVLRRGHEVRLDGILKAVRVFK